MTPFLTGRSPCPVALACALALLPVSSACTSDPAEPTLPVRQEITLTDVPHHLGDNTGAEGDAYSVDFEITAAVDSASIRLTFLYPNPQGQSGPEIGNAPQLILNGTLLGLTAADFPDSGACVVGTGDAREYACDLTVSRPASSAIVTGENHFSLLSEAAWGGDDDFVFTDLIVTIWR